MSSSEIDINLPSHPLLQGYAYVLTQPVQWGDQDAFQHVNNTIYLRWFESARIVYFGLIGLSELYAGERIGPIMAAISCNYRKPVVFPDTVQVGARIEKLGRTSLVMTHAVVSLKQGAVVADGGSTIVLIDYATGKPTPLPDGLRRRIAEFEEKPFD